MTKKKMFYVANYDKEGNFTTFTDIGMFDQPISSHTMPLLFESRNEAIEFVEDAEAIDSKCQYWHVRELTIDVPKLTEKEIEEMDND